MRFNRQTASAAARTLLAGALVALAVLDGGSAQLFPVRPALAQAVAEPAAPAAGNGGGTAAPATPASPAPATPAAAAPAQPGTPPAAAPAAQPARPAPDPTVTALREKLDGPRSALDSVDGALKVEGLRTDDLDELRNRIDPIRRELAQHIEDVSPRIADTKGRLAAIGPKPAADAPPEDPAVTADRERLERLSAELGAAMTQLVAMSANADRITDQISARRRALFTGQLFERSQSFFDPALWTGAAGGLSSEMRALRWLLADWGGYAGRFQTPFSLFGIALGALAIGLLVITAGRFIRRWLRTPPPADGAPVGRLRAALEGLKAVLLDALAAPLAVVAAVTFARSFDVIPPRADEVVHGFVVAVFIQAVGCAVARGLLAPDAAWRRLPPMSDRWARIGYRYSVLAVWTLAVGAFLNALHRALFAQLHLTVLTSALMALLICMFSTRFLVKLTPADAEDAPEDDPRQWVRGVVWLVVALLLGALATGYVSFATFVASRMVVAATVLGGYYLLVSLIDGFIEQLSSDAGRTRKVARTLGLKPNGLELISVVASGVLKVLLFLLALFLIVGSWGTSTADVMDTVERATFGIRIGNINLTLAGVLNAVVLLAVSLTVARILQRWVAGSLLPRTRLEPSLQASIATVVGYIGYIIALMVSMSELGLSLENLALVAGALSVGVGFGLQAIVSNFVSGLILLAERPIRVGDTIAVKGEEGYVRRISVRSTEIETFDRASVIVPNSDLITGVVKNWTHTNTTGRVVIAINVAYDADAEQVRDILVACASEHPQVLKSPPPRVFLTKFADLGMAFELRCVVANVDYSLTVKSDLNFQVLARFRKAGISLAYQPWAASAPPPEPAATEEAVAPADPT